ncbi:hypothetical protein [Rubrobacter aplysinae]|uniref:hypothetical protein n=1 Tax=Rubrobacter aplysinae TaxID=909625 RepID=UPI00064BC7B2|nr:hypothetical protein [Rubrobacter aplysinae]
MDAPENELALLKDGLATEIRRASGGELPGSVVVLIRDDRLPMVQFTNSHGVVASKSITYPDLLGALDDSSVVESLSDESTRTTKLPVVPDNTLLVDVNESPAGRSYTVTGYTEPDTYLFCLESNREGYTVTFEVLLPYLVWSIVYEEASRTVSRFSLTLCSPERGYPRMGQLEESEASPAGLSNDEGPQEQEGSEGESSATKRWTPPGPDTPLYRYPASNVYHAYRGALEGVCWPTMDRIQMSLKEVPSKAVRAFLELPNNMDLYGRGFSHNGPQKGYREFLEHLESEGLPEEYLIPTEMTVQGLHDQQRGA